MGNAFSNCSGTTPALTDSTQNNDEEYSNGYFTKIELIHLQSVQKEVCEKTRNNQGNLNLIKVVWEYAHAHALNSELGEYKNQVQQRCEQMQLSSNGLNFVNALNYVLMQKLRSTDDNFVEFVSNICSGAYGHKSTLEFVWEVCSFDGSTINMKNEVSARDVIQLCLEMAELAHCMVLDEALQTAQVKEARHSSHLETIIQSLSSSSLEHARSCQQDFSYGESSSANTQPHDENETISKSCFIEWHRKITPDLLQNSLAKFLQILFFPPQFDDHKSVPLLRKYSQIIPVLHSSKELSPRVAANLKKGEVLPMKSTIFGCNYIDTHDMTSDSTGKAASTSFRPEVFAFTTISASKFGNKWYRVYSGTEDGWTYNQLEHSIIGYQGPTLVVIQASSKDHPDKSVTFGAYTASKWEKNKKDFFGSPDCFLFQLQPELKVLKSLPKIGTRGGHYMYFHSNINVVSNNLAKKDEMMEGLGFGGTTRNPRLFIDSGLEECKVSSHCTTFEEGNIGFPPPNDPMSFSHSKKSSCSVHIDSLEIYAVGGNDTIQRGFQALNQYRDIADANLRNARTVDTRAFLSDLRNGVIDSKAFAHRGQVDGRANGCMKGEEEGKVNGL